MVHAIVDRADIVFVAGVGLVCVLDAERTEVGIGCTLGVHADMGAVVVSVEGAMQGDLVWELLKHMIIKITKLVNKFMFILILNIR